jgi:hypothetical protein
MKSHIGRLTAVVSGLLICVALLGCGKKKDEPLPVYEGWEKYTYRHFVYHYERGEYWGRNIDRFANFNERYLLENCEFLAIDIPTDTIHYYIHMDSANAAALLGHEIPYVTSNQIHWGRPVPLGVPIIAYLIPKMKLRATDFRVLHDGLIALRDYSGHDYHDLTGMLHKIGQYIPLDSMFNNEAFLRRHILYRRQEAASLVAYITYTYGINRFKMLWQSAADYKKSIEELFRTDFSKFEADWETFVKERFTGFTIQKDTLIDDSVVREVIEVK